MTTEIHERKLDKQDDIAEELQESSPATKINEEMIVPAQDTRTEQHRRREEEESLELARMIMAEEAMASYQQSVQFFCESRDQLSAEAVEALEAALHEEEVHHDGAGYHGIVEDEEGNLSYETMLQLGEQIGDVKTERWNMIAKQYIEKLPTETYGLSHVGTDADDSERKCLICQHEYLPHEKLRRLPMCKHCFHVECCDRWLSRTDLCPYCRTPIRKESSPK